MLSLTSDEVDVRREIVANCLIFCVKIEYFARKPFNAILFARI